MNSEAWDKGYVIGWYALIALIILYELYTLLDKRTSTPPLTRVIIQRVPWWITVPFLFWLFVHFTSRYFGHPIL
jgi:hypothetical protein